MIKIRQLKVDWIVNLEMHDNMIWCLCYGSCNAEKKPKKFIFRISPRIKNAKGSI